MAAPVLHAAALFSNSFILAEGRMLGFGLATLTLLLARSALLPLLAAPEQPQQQRPGGGCRVMGSTASAGNWETPTPDTVQAPHGQRSDDACQCAVPDGDFASGLYSEAHTATAAHDNVVSDAAAAAPRLAVAAANDSRRTVHVLAIGGAALMLLWALGRRGLVVRSGHDAMWRTAAEHRTVLPSPAASAQAQDPNADSSWIAGAAAEYLPLAVLPWLLLRAKRRMLAQGR